MGLGNGNAKQGDRGSNHNYEHRNLLALGNIVTALGPLGTGATEATLQLVLTAIQSGSEFEARLVEDALSVTWLEVRTWNTSTGTWNAPLYYPPGSNTPGSPTLPVVYINNSSVLATISSNTTGLNLEVTQLLIKGVLDAIKLDTANLDVALSTVATETTLAAINAKFNSLGQKASAGSVPVVLSTEQEAMIDGIEGLLTTINTAVGGTATEVTLLATNALLTTIDTVLDNILLDTTAILADTASIDIATTGLNTPVTGLTSTNLRVTGAGAATVAAGNRRVSFFNAGNADTTVAGATLKRGEVVTFSADGLRDTLAAIGYDALTSELLISTVG